METRVAEIADGVHQLTTHVAEIDLGFNQYLVTGEEPLLFHTGMRVMFPLVRDAVASIIPVESLRWISFGHFEADECGAMNQWLAVAPEAHEAAWDGLLAVRCWRDLDQAVPAEDLELRELARDQYDRAVLRGFAAIVRARLVSLTESACDEAHEADIAFVRAVAPLMDRVMRTRSPEETDAMRAALGFDEPGEEVELDIERAIEALDATLACP